MMNDRFDAQLRQHLVGAADERAVPGQLAGIVQAIAGTPQRHPIAARLAWLSGRLGPIPNRGLRSGLVVLALVAAGAAVAVLGASKPSPSTVVTSPTPGPATQPPATPTAVPSGPGSTAPPELAQCTEFNTEGTYTANVGTLPVSLTVPGTASAPWAGSGDAFFLQRAPCDSAGSPVFRAALVAHIYGDACHWTSSTVDVPTAFEAAAELAKQEGHDTVGPAEAHLGPFRATRFELSVPGDFSSETCDAGAIKLWADTVIVPGTTVQVYVAEVDGTTLVVTASYETAEATPALLDEIAAVLATLRIDI